MKTLIAVSLIVGLVRASGCTPTDGVLSPTKPIVSPPDKTDFGFAGTWRQATDSARGELPQQHRGDQQPVVVTMGDDGTYSVVGVLELDITCRAAALEEQGFALVEVEARPKQREALPQDAAEGVRFLLVAKREKDSLFFRYVHTQELARLMADEGYNVEVSPPGYFAVKVAAEPKELLVCIRKHWSKLSREPTIRLINVDREQGDAADSR